MNETDVQKLVLEVLGNGPDEDEALADKLLDEIDAALVEQRAAHQSVMLALEEDAKASRLRKQARKARLLANAVSRHVMVNKPASIIMVNFQGQTQV